MGSVRIAIGAMLLLLAASPLGVQAAGPIVPDSSCADEGSYKSLQGDMPAQLQVFNKSPQTVKVWWLDYNGKRLLYQQLPPFTYYVQPTWLTHPWVITNVGGQCYRFLVMTSQLQSVTVEGEPPDPDTTALPLSARASAAPSPGATVVPTAGPTSALVTPGAPSSSATASAGGTAPPGSSDAGSDNTALVVGAAVIVVAGAGLAATGRLPGMRRGGPRAG